MPPLSIEDKLTNCKAVQNKSFDPQNTTLEEFRLPWDRLWSLWAATSSPPPPPVTATESWIQRLWSLHTEPTRHYHTVIHLQEMFDYLETIQEDLRLTSYHKAVISLSIYFHDAIYNPHSGTNEEDSEKLWQTFAQESQLPATTVQEVSDFILATKHHIVSTDHSHVMALFLDLDLAVLAKEPTAYLAYAAAIRREYHFVPVETYCTKRAEILQAMAQRDDLFGSRAFQSAFDDPSWSDRDRARSNLRNEIELLRQGKVPE